MCAHPHAHTLTHSHTCTLTLIHTLTLTHTHAHTHSYTLKHLHTCTLTQTHTCTHAHTHTHTLTLAHMHTHNLLRRPSEQAGCEAVVQSCAPGTVWSAQRQPTLHEACVSGIYSWFWHLSHVFNALVKTGMAGSAVLKTLRQEDGHRASERDLSHSKVRTTILT